LSIACSVSPPATSSTRESEVRVVTSILSPPGPGWLLVVKPRSRNASSGLGGYTDGSFGAKNETESVVTLAARKPLSPVAVSVSAICSVRSVIPRPSGRAE
jgi:hypothetical protein